MKDALVWSFKFNKLYNKPSTDTIKDRESIMNLTFSSNTLPPIKIVNINRISQFQVDHKFRQVAFWN